MPAVIDFRERLYVSQFGIERLGLAVHRAGILDDVDVATDVTVTLLDSALPTPAEVFSRTADHTAVGIYEILTTSADTQTPGDYTVHWDFTLDGIAQIFESHIQIGVANPSYDNLPPDLKDVVDDVWIKFADLFDSPEGGPNLQTYFQSHWSRGRVAQLLKTAVGLLNTTAQPHQTYTIDHANNPFPTQVWGPLLGQSLYVEVLKHLVRSYVEQPVFQGSGAVSRLDRRDYMDRWMQVLQMEQGTLKSQLDTFKISNMGLGRPKILVSGGVYGRFGPTRFAGSMAARPRFWARFY